MVERNAEMFRAVASAIEAEPGRYDQGRWGDVMDTHDDGNRTIHYFDSVAEAVAADEGIGTCGTYMCIAGHTAAIAGYRPKVHRYGDRVRLTYDEVHDPSDEDRTGPTRPCRDVAEELLGLSMGERRELFDGGMTFTNGDAVKSLRMLADGASVWDVCEC